MNGTKAKMEAAGETFSEEKFAAVFPKMAPITVSAPPIPFIGISEDAFFKMYEECGQFTTIPEALKIDSELTLLGGRLTS